MALNTGDSMVQIEPGNDSVDISVVVGTRGVDRSRCELEHVVDPDKPEVAPSRTGLDPREEQIVSLVDGLHRFELSCPSSIGMLEKTRTVLARDYQPERCAGVEFEDGPISISTFDELEAGMLGSWEGCVRTPWTPAYWVSFAFHPDGTYSAVTDEEFDGMPMNAMYYGIQLDAPHKRWALNDLQDSLRGVGQIDIIWDAGPGVSRGELRNIELMGDHLRFEFFHFGDYGPITFELDRAD